MISGETAAINGIACLKYFKIQTRGINEGDSCSAALGAEFRGIGNKDWFGVARGIGHTPPKMPNNKFQFLGTDRNGQGWQSGAAGTTPAAESCIVSKVVITAHVAMPPFFFYYDIYFFGNGSLTAGAYSAPSVGTRAPTSSQDMGITIGATPLTELIQWELEIGAKLAQPRWSGDRDGWPGRAGGPLNASARWDQFFDTAANLPAFYDPQEYQFDIAVAPATPASWNLEFMQVEDMPVEYTIVDESGATGWVQASRSEAHWTSYDPAAATQGTITNPAGVAVWPVP